MQNRGDLGGSDAGGVTGNPSAGSSQGTPLSGGFLLGMSVGFSLHWWQTVRQLGSFMKVGHSGDNFPESLRLNID